MIVALSSHKRMKRSIINDFGGSPALESQDSSPTRCPRTCSPSTSALASSLSLTPSIARIGTLCSPDILILFSKSGNTEELLCLIPYIKAKGAYLVSVTSIEGNPPTSACDMNVRLLLERELCPFDFAPLTSTTIQMVFGDTVAIVLMGDRNLTKKEFAANHFAEGSGRA